jgi:hypothetical protein
VEAGWVAATHACHDVFDKFIYAKSLESEKSNETKLLFNSTALYPNYLDD